MKNYAYWFLCVGLLGAPYYCSAQKEEISVMPNQNQKIGEEPMNELDSFFDNPDAIRVADDVEIKEPSPLVLMIRRVLSPLAQIYTFTTLKFRKFKSWFVQQALYLRLIRGNSNDQKHESHK